MFDSLNLKNLYFLSSNTRVKHQIIHLSLGLISITSFPWNPYMNDKKLWHPISFALAALTSFASDKLKKKAGPKKTFLDCYLSIF